MFLIVIFHVFEYVLIKYEVQYPIISSLYTLSHIGVIIFFLISGYYGIKPSIRGLFKLYVWMVSINVLLYSCSVLYGVEPFSKTEVFKLFLPFSHSAPWLWFMRVYVLLYLISPLLNMARKEMHLSFMDGGGIVLIIIWLISFWFGWINRSSDLYDGKNIINASFLYLLGSRFALFPPFRNKTNEKQFYFSIYLGLCILVGVSLFVAEGRFLRVLRWLCHPYCSPVLICMASSLFLFFTKLEFHNKFVNWFASSILTVYLIHENKFCMSIWHGFIDWYPFIDNAFNNSPLWRFVLILIGGALCIMIGAVLIDKVRSFILQPVFILFDKLYDHSISFFKGCHCSSWSRDQ